MSGTHPGEFYPFSGPTIYHQEETFVRKPPRAHADEMVHEKLHRTTPSNSHLIGTHFNKSRRHSFLDELKNQPVHPNKHIFYETIAKKKILDDEDRFSEEKYLKSKPFILEGNRPHENYGSTYYDGQYGGRKISGRYTPPQYSRQEEAPPRLLWSRVRNILRKPLAEFFGIFILVLFGDGSIAQVVLSKNKNGEWQSICWGWGIGIMIGAYTAGISGANLNPAVTLANCVLRKQSWHTLPSYTIAHILGAYCAAAVVYGNYKNAIDLFEGGSGVRTVPGSSKHATAGIFATYPQEFVTRTTEFFNEFIAAAILMFCIYALQENKNLGASNLLPLALLFVVFGIGACFGWQTGFAINMARDFGPRLMTYTVGYGKEVWTASNYYFWIPMVAPFFGCLFGGWLYDAFLYTGESPVNTPWLGLKRLIRPKYKKNYIYV
ncbi:Aquaporin-10 [Golovinomyces cichoracearum]|uniref:Aquaporin-10 n=1 Tax=Golovinomyces cichoracearum TaxID=62708 RepID=A0A420J5V6_9PEZI|nr:Aquaporin-10 [Golovinomyces cichoracearum]